jgi:predicted TIM-barrel fold metal-dependent hydrolase
MVIDVNAFIGTWPSHPVIGDLKAVRDSLRAYGVDRIFVSPLEAAWCRNPHRFNQSLYRAVEAFDDVWPVPVLDPTVATWRKELDRAVGATHASSIEVRLVRLLPAYSPYKLSEADALLEALTVEGLGAIVQTRLEDPRRQHPLAQVPDVPAAEVVDAAERHPDLTVIIGGPRAGEIRALKDRLLGLPNLYADVSQAEGIDVLPGLVKEGLTAKLVFGSHAPIFIPHAALSRVLTDLDNETAAAILGGNAAGILGWEA